MDRVELLGWAGVVLGASVLMLATGGCTRTGEQAGVDPTARIPGSIAGWQAGEVASYDPESIFSYIDGHAEVYLAYGMEACHARRFAGPEGEPDIVVDVFRLPSSFHAYGVFTHEPDGEPLDIGQDGLAQAGWLRFWKGRFFVSVYPEGESERAAEAAMAIARAVDAAIAQTGERPPLTEVLPEPGRVERTVRWVCSGEVLANILLEAPENPYQVGPDAPAATAEYRRDGVGARLVAVEQPDPEQARQAYDRLVALRGVATEEGSPSLAQDGSWWTAVVEGSHLLVATDAEAPGLAAALVDEAATTLRSRGGSDG